MIGRGNIIFGSACIAVALAMTAASFAIGQPGTAIMNLVTFTVGVTQIAMGLGARRELRRIGRRQ